MEVRLIVKKGRTTTNELSLRRFPTLIGRHRECNLRIAARQVSRRHCALKDRDGWLIVSDLGSCNGTLVNGEHVRGESVLQPGDVLEIGPISFEIDYSAPNASRSDAASGETLIMSTDTTPNVDCGPEPASDNAYELSERISELNRERAYDAHDTQRFGSDAPSASDSGSKIITFVDDGSDSAASPTHRIFSSDVVEEHSAPRRQ